MVPTATGSLYYTEPANSHAMDQDPDANFIIKDLISTAINIAEVHQQASVLGYEDDLGISQQLCSALKSQWPNENAQQSAVSLKRNV